jgi:glucose/arabinose dehydrogenase
MARQHMSHGIAALRVLVVALIASSALLADAPTRAQEPGFDPASFQLSTELLVDGLTNPVQMVDPDDGSGRLFIVQQTGQIVILRDGAILPEPFLDIGGQISTGSEQGLLSMAPHPGFEKNSVFFIYYTDGNGNTQVERWSVNANTPDLADPASAETILTVEQPYPNHNGGLLLFGPDGYLYIGLGDGGAGGDPHNHAQDLSTLLGSILRIDVDSTTGDLPYGIPEDNPFVGQEGVRGEIWAYGLRNPWRYSFDRKTGDMLIADVGQNAIEEASLAPAGEGGLNFGWNLFEGPQCYALADCDPSDTVLPFFWYAQEDGGCSITGGYVYRGEAIPELAGVYLVGDYCSGLVWAVAIAEDGSATPSAPVETGLAISSFAEDASGELYLVDRNGAIYKIVPGES